MTVIHCRDFLRYPEVIQIISEPYWCYSWLQLSVHWWLGWTSVSHQSHVPSSDSDINALPNDHLHCTWTNWDGQNKDCIWDCQFLEWNWGWASSQTLSVPVSFQEVDLDSHGLQVLALQSCRACLAEKKVCFPAQFLCLEIGTSFQLKP